MMEEKKSMPIRNTVLYRKDLFLKLKGTLSGEEHKASFSILARQSRICWGRSQNPASEGPQAASYEI
jgi:hypothetical protein